MPALEMEYARNILMVLLEPLSHSGSTLCGLPDPFVEALHQCALSRREDRNPIAFPGVWPVVPFNKVLSEARSPIGARAPVYGGFR